MLTEMRLEECELDCALIGKRVRTARKAKKVTQEELSEHCGCTPTHICNLENGKIGVSLELLFKISIYLDKDYVVIDVPRAARTSKPIYVGTDMFKGSYRRNHEGDYLCTEAEIKTMIRDSLDTSADSAVLDNVGMDALNSDSIKSYRTRFEMIRSGHTWNALPNDEFLIKIGAARVAEYDGKIHPTLGGLIFFGDFINIMNELPDFFLDYREKLAIDTRWSDRVCSGDGDWSGNVYDFYFRIVDRLTADVKKPFVINKNLLRDDDTDIHKSLREALANALIHADYYGRQGIVIEKDFRKMKFSNPGIFRISLDDAIAGGTSDARNSRIFNMFALIKVGERSGMGLCDIYNYWKEYKVEKYINECVDSLVDQSLENIEIILVDDGSPDNCPAICDEYAARYDNVKVIHKTNGGSVSARKEGFRYCHGTYVTFVDGDDWIEKDYFRKVIALMEEYSPDMICVTRYFEAEDRKKFFIREQPLGSGLYNRCMLEKEIFPRILYQPPFFSFGVSPSIWSKFIKHEFLFDLVLDEPEEIKMGDDLAVTLPCMLKADSIYFSDICGYYYRQNPSSITHAFDSTASMRVNSLLNYLCKKTEAYDGYNIKNQISFYAVHILQHTITSLIQGSNNMRDDLKLMNPLWKNASLKKGLKSKVPLNVKLLILAAKSRQVLILKIIKKRWEIQKEKGVKV